MRRRSGTLALVGLVAGAVGLVAGAVAAAARRERYARCYWCWEYVVDLTRETYRAEMLAHFTVCPAHPLKPVWSHPSGCLKPLIEQHVAGCHTNGRARRAS